MRHLVESHGGTIAVASLGENQGTTFTVKLPLVRQADSRIELDTDQNQAPASTYPLQNVRVLIVVDEPDARDLAVFILEGAGAIAITANNAAEALAVCAHSIPDVIVSDIGMPLVDGYTLLRRIRATSSTQNIPAIALTAYAGELNQQQALRAGFQQHLTKPIEPAALVQAVVNLLRPLTQSNQ